jgi:hypothetical protein
VEVKHCVMDLEDMIKSMQDRLQRNVDDVKKMGRELTEVEDARFEVGSLLLMDIVDDLQGVVAAWKDNAPARRVTEEAIEKGS